MFNQMDTAKNLIEDIRKGYNVFTSSDVDFFMNKYNCISLLRRYLDYDESISDNEQTVLFTLLICNDYPKKFEFNMIPEQDQRKFVRKNQKLLPPLTDPYQTMDERYHVYESIGALLCEFYCTDVNNEENSYLAPYVKKIDDKWVVTV